jgi:hypothetical protein
MILDSSPEKLDASRATMFLMTLLLVVYVLASGKQDEFSDDSKNATEIVVYVFLGTFVLHFMMSLFGMERNSNEGVGVIRKLRGLTELFVALMALAVVCMIIYDMSVNDFDLGKIDNRFVIVISSLALLMGSLYALRVGTAAFSRGQTTNSTGMDKVRAFV